MPRVTITGEFAGRYDAHFEDCNFVPEAGAVNGPDGNVYKVQSAWVDVSESARWPNTFSPEQLQGSYRVRWRGTLSGPGNYGHWPYRLLVEEVIETKPITSDQVEKALKHFLDLGLAAEEAIRAMQKVGGGYPGMSLVQ